MRWILAIVMLVAAVLPARALDLMSSEEAREAALAGEILLIDIRTPEEWKESGVADVAHTMDMRDKDFILNLLKLQQANPGKPLAMICRTGGRSGFVTKALTERGMTGLIDVAEGMHGSDAGPGWLKRSLPVRSPDDLVIE